MTEYFRLPMGGTTTDKSERSRAWFDLGDQVAEFFPGYEALGFDPGIQLVSHDPEPYSDHIALTMPSIKAMLNGRLQTQKRIKELEKELEELLDKAVRIGIDGALEEVRKQGANDCLLASARRQGLRDAESYISSSRK